MFWPHTRFEIHLIIKGIAQVGSRDRPHLNSGLQRISNLEGLGARHKSFKEPVGDSRRNDKPLCRNATLPRIRENLAVTATSMVRSRSASSRTMNGSEPPSSSTNFLHTLPAAQATLCPARTLPVNVTARMRASAMSRSTQSRDTTRFCISPSPPAKVTASSSACAQP